MDNFKDRLIELTSNKIALTNEYEEIERTLDSTDLSDRTRERIVRKLGRKQQELNHLEKNITLNIHLCNQ